MRKLSRGHASAIGRGGLVAEFDEKQSTAGKPHFQFGAGLLARIRIRPFRFYQPPVTNDGVFAGRGNERDGGEEGDDGG